MKSEIALGGTTTAVTGYVGDYFEITTGTPRPTAQPTAPNCGVQHCVFLPMVSADNPSIPAGHAWRSYYYAEGSRVAMRVQSNQQGLENGVYYFLTDHLGSTAATLTADGTTLAEQRYKAWGETVTPREPPSPAGSSLVRWTNLP